MNRRALVSSLGSLALAAAAAIGTSRLLPKKPGKGGPVRLVTLSPALTETVLALGGQPLLAGVSDYCVLPEGVKLPRVGSSLTPNYEAIARLHPTLILSDDSAQAKHRELSALASCEVLPWLTLPQVVSSTRRIGQTLGNERAGNELADELNARLSAPPPASAPRVLLLLSYDPDRPAEIWFIRPNSLHGAALTAAGAKNAIDHDVTGLPRLGIEQLIALDPDEVLIIPAPGATRERREQMLSGFSKLAPLRAVKDGRIAVVAGANQSQGPGILKLVDALAATLGKLAGPHPASGLVE